MSAQITAIASAILAKTKKPPPKKGSKLPAPFSPRTGWMSGGAQTRDNIVWGNASWGQWHKQQASK